MKLKKLLAGAALALGMLFSVNSEATTANYTTYVDGQVLTAGSLNSLQTHYTDADNAILNGDTFTGTVNLHSGADVNVYSDTGSTLKASIDGATGDAILSLRQIGQSVNCEINYSAGTVTISGWGGAALSATNPCVVGIRSNSNGVVARAYFTANITTTDGATSDTDGNLLGITDADWASAMPIFFGVVYDGTTPYFGFGRKPHVVTGAAAGNLAQEGDTDGDGEDDFFIMTTGLTLASWVNLPITQVAWLTATFATASDTWTFAETAYTGFNYLYEVVDFTMPLAQKGAATGTYFTANGGTAPLFTTNNYVYQVDRNCFVTAIVDLEDDAGTDGAGAVTSQLTLPYAEAVTGGYYSGVFTVTSVGGAATTQNVIANPSSSVMGLQETAGGTIQNGDFSNGGRNVIGSVTYPCL